MPHETLTWAEFGSSCRQLARRIHADGYRPELILAIARGGLFPAGGLGLCAKPRSSVKCEYVWRYTDRWIDFPWSAEAPVT